MCYLKSMNFKDRQIRFAGYFREVRITDHKGTQGLWVMKMFYTLIWAVVNTVNNMQKILLGFILKICVFYYLQITS